VAQSLVREIGCAVLAMRYPVGDEFAIDLGEKLYRNVIERRHPLPRALQMALGETSRSPLSDVTPALFGKQAVDLILKAPSEDFDHPQTRPFSGLAGFPDPPELFVGRVRPMVEAGRVMAPEGDKTGVLYLGMSGAGKTACAVELAHHYGDLDRFTDFVWYKAPDEGNEISGSLARFANAFEAQLSDEKGVASFRLVHMMAEEEGRFDVHLTKLRKFLEGRSVLIVLDNLEGLLRPDGQWRDPRWGKLVATLLSHRGLSRMVLTSRICPTIPPAPLVSGGPSPQSRLLPVPIHALALEEAALLARQLPNLGGLLRGDGVIDDQERERHRQLVARMLKLVQCHPKLIELAEGQAVDPMTLAGHLERASFDRDDVEVGADRLGAFFREGESKQEADAFLRILSGWTASIVDTLPNQSRTLFHLLACLEEGDRQSLVLADNWPNLWKRLELSGDPPDLDATLLPLEKSGLVEIQAIDLSGDPVADEQRSYAIHPGVARAGRNEAGDAFRAAVDAELSTFLWTVFDRGRMNEMSGLGYLVVGAGLAAAPYMMRQQRWDDSSRLLEQVIRRDETPTTIAAVLPLLEHIAKATKNTERSLIDAGVLARALSLAGRRKEAESILRSIMDEAAIRKEYRSAAAAAGDLIYILKATGQSKAALEIIVFKKEMTARGGFGPWSQLGDENHRLQLLVELGRYEEALAEAKGLRSRMEQLPDPGDQEEAVEPWSLRESIINTGRAAAFHLKHFDLALELSGEIQEAQKSRGASKLEITRDSFNDYGPLIELSRYDEARALILHCRSVFEEEGDLTWLGMTFSALANLDDELGHTAPAVINEQTALRFLYSISDSKPEGCAICHLNLASYLIQCDGPSTSSLAHRLAATLIVHQTASGRLDSALQALSHDLTSFEPGPPPVPSSFVELCQIVEQEEGVRFAELFARLPTGRAATGDEALQQVLELARSQSEPDESGMPPELAQLVGSLFEAGTAGRTDEVETLLLSIRQCWLQAKPGEEEQAEAAIADLREQVAGMDSAGEEPGPLA
jgi:tetratricopeptide (TPR) repeat protein